MVYNRFMLVIKTNRTLLLLTRYTFCAPAFLAVLIVQKVEAALHQAYSRLHFTITLHIPLMQVQK